MGSLIELERWMLETFGSPGDQRLPDEMERRVFSAYSPESAQQTIGEFLDRTRVRLNELLGDASAPDAVLGSIPVLHVHLPATILPPDDHPRIQTGSGEGMKPIEYSPRLQLLIQFLQRHGIFIDDLVALTGENHPRMMRAESYAAIEIPRINKAVLVCNVVGEATFVTPEIYNRETYFRTTKEQLQTMLGVRRIVFHTQGQWEAELEEALFPPSPGVGAGESPMPPPPTIGPKINVREREWRTLIRELLESEGVVRIEERENESSGQKQKVLLWLKVINTRKKYGECDVPLCTLLGRLNGVDGSSTYISFASAMPAIRALYPEAVSAEPGNPNMRFEFADLEGKKDLLRDLLEKEGAVQVEEVEGDDPETQQTKKILVWLKLINPDSEYQQYTSRLNILLGKVMGVDGGKAYKSLSSIIPVIRSLYQGRVNGERPGNADMRFELADQEGRQALLRDVFEGEDVLRLEERNTEASEQKKRALVWLKTVDVQDKPVSYGAPLKVLVGQAMGVNGRLEFGSFMKMTAAIREMYKGKFDIEETGNPDMRFEFADEAERKALLRDLLEKENVVRIEKREGGSALIWLKPINPTKSYQGYDSNLNLLLGRVMNIAGTKKYLSFPSIVEAIRSLYQDLVQIEEVESLDMSFEPRTWKNKE
jgi:hypothetical protein